jgi:AcrR family transcriptional regulator
MASSPPAPDHSSRKARGRKASTKSALTRKVILDGAAELFAERGYKLTTLNDIAEKIGVHLTGLYYYYDNKEQLASDVIASSAVTIREALDAAIAELPEGATALAKIEVAVDVYLECVLGPAHLMRAAAHHLADLARDAQPGAHRHPREQPALVRPDRRGDRRGHDPP